MSKEPDLDSLERFVADVVPFFLGHNVAYVDVGAHKGAVLTAFCDSSLNIGEAHLFEPNPDSFKVLQRVAATAFHRRSLNLYPVAVGEQVGTVIMQTADTMTKVVQAVENAADASSLPNSNAFIAPCTTLDECRGRFTDGHISILKIDVEGFEAQVLRGAAQLLGQQKVDVVYIEAGLNPQGTQQTYYRIIDDLMLGYGYRIFRIYEQKHEWMEDSPFLRRMNLAYFSQRFADRHPYKLTQALYQEQLRLSAVKAGKAPVAAEMQPKPRVTHPVPTAPDNQKTDKLHAQLEAERLRHAEERGRLLERARFFEELSAERQEELEHLRRRLESKRD